MYMLVSLEKIALFFSKYNIDISSLSGYELSVIVILCNIFILLFYLFLFYVVWHLIFRIIDWWF